MNRTRPACSRDIKSFFHNLRNIASVFYEIIMLGYRKSYPQNIHLLKSVRTDHITSYLPCYRNHWNRVHISIGYSRHKICRTRTGSRKTNSNLATRASISICSESRALLVSYENMMKSLVIRKSIEKRYYSSTRISEHDGCAFCKKAFENYMCACEGSHKLVTSNL